MASVTEIRAWLRDQGHDVPARGKLRPELTALYDEAHGDTMPDDPWPDDDDLDPAGADDTTAEVRDEVTPSRKAARTRTTGTAKPGLLGKLLGAADAKGTTKAKAKKVQRVGLERFVGRSYKMAGRVLAPLSPAASMTVMVQAPMAGVILNDIVQGTVVDRILQPVARAEEKLDAVFALMVPPAAAIGIEMSFMQEQTPQVVFRRGVLIQMMREGLRTGLEVSEKYADQIAAYTQREVRYDEEVDRLMALIFPPPPQATAEDVREPEMAGAA